MTSYILPLHLTIILICFASFALSLGVWKNLKKKTGHVSESWKLFTIGLLFLGLAELVDIFTPLSQQVFAGINFYSEVSETAALAILFLGIIGFLRKRLEGRS